MHLVARGFDQIEGQDYHESFAPTVRTETIKAALTMAAKEGMRI